MHVCCVCVCVYGHQPLGGLEVSALGGFRRRERPTIIALVLVLHGGDGTLRPPIHRPHALARPRCRAGVTVCHGALRQRGVCHTTRGVFDGARGAWVPEGTDGMARIVDGAPPTEANVLSFHALCASAVLKANSVRQGCRCGCRFRCRFRCRLGRRFRFGFWCWLRLGRWALIDAGHNPAHVGAMRRTSHRAPPATRGIVAAHSTQGTRSQARVRTSIRHMTLIRERVRACACACACVCACVSACVCT